MKALAAIRDLAAIALLIVLTLLLWNARTGLVKITTDLAATQKQLRATLLDVSRMTQDATGVTAELRKTLKASQDSSRQVAANSALATQQAAAAVGSLNDLVRHTDAQINSQLLPQLTAAIGQQNTNMTDVATELRASLGGLNQTETALQPVLKNAAEASANAAKISGDPSIAATLKNLDAASAGMASTAQNAANASHDLAAAVHRETRPASFTVKVAGWVIGGATKAASIVAGFVK